MSAGNPLGPRLGRRLPPNAGRIVASFAVAAAAVGFIAGARPPEGSARPGSEVAAAGQDGKQPSYEGLRGARRGPNANMYDDAIAGLPQRVPLVGEPLSYGPEERRAAVGARAKRRAYDGAPPTIPHDVAQLSVPSCLACHENGTQVGDKFASRISHERYASCTQCHVVDFDPVPGRGLVGARENTFAGLASAGVGPRAWPGAPPTIPHPTLMRGECSACHGAGALHGLRTPHPYRQSCTQCHVPSAGLDQRTPTLPVAPWAQAQASW